MYSLELLHWNMHNVCFYGEIRKIFFWKLLLSSAMFLLLSTLGNVFSRWHFEKIFLTFCKRTGFDILCTLSLVDILKKFSYFLQKNRIWHFMHIASSGHFEKFFLLFAKEQDLTFYAHRLQWRWFAWNVKSCLLGKIRKISICRLLNFCPESGKS